MSIYTGIGSRETPVEILEQMTILGRYLAAQGHYVRSGHAIGADYAFEQGALKNCLVYLPWQGFGDRDHPMLGSSIVVPANSQYDEMINKFHPNGSKLSNGARALMRRNSCQVLGLKLDSPVKAVICWTPNASGSGGTGQALRIARHYSIPVIDMANSKYSTAEAVLAVLP
jgi:hypothetical protein